MLPVVVELLLAVALGPRALGLHVTELISFFADLGLGLLFFFAAPLPCCSTAARSMVATVSCSR